jgi:DNA-binding SARP family transcriptional activator
VRFRILGPLEVLSPDGWTAISAAKWRSLLACLLVRPGQLVPTENLIFELWGDAPPGTANNLVSIYVHQLKKVIGDTERRVLVYRAPGYMLRIAPGDLDIQQFESLAAEGRGALAAGDPERASPMSCRHRSSRPTHGTWPSCGSTQPSCALRRTLSAAGRLR